jgi:hypothetical protein
MSFSKQVLNLQQHQNLIASPPASSYAGHEEELQVVSSERRKEEASVLALGCAGHGIGWRRGSHSPRLLARQNELARPVSGSFLPGVPGLWNQAPLRRERLSRLRTIQLRSQSPDRLGASSPRQAETRRQRTTYRLLSREPAGLLGCHPPQA